MQEGSLSAVGQSVLFTQESVLLKGPDGVGEQILSS